MTVRVSSAPARSIEPYVRDAMAILGAPVAAWPDGLEGILARDYGWAGAITPVSSEAEHTARLDGPCGTPLILKVSSRAEALESFRFQAAVLAGLEGARGFEAPHLLRTRSNDPCFEHERVWGYVQTAIHGTQLGRTEIGPGQLRATGKALGALDDALGRLVIPGADRPVLWNIGCWPGLLHLMPYIGDEPTADLVRDAMERYVERALPLLPELHWQTTHNDPSPHNIFVRGNEIAFIDFGDGGRAPRLQDLAVAMSHFVLDPSLALGGAEPLIVGYDSVLPLSALEASLLVDLVRARQAALILVNAWRATLFPDAAAYINKNVARAVCGLSILAPLDGPGAETAVLSATGRRQQRSTGKGR